MKRVGNLFEQVVDFENLLRASHDARLGKRLRSYCLDFHHNLEENLLTLARELAGGTYRPGEYRTFHIVYPKKRLISAAPYRDRVLHHAVFQIVEPIFERSFIFDSYACRKGKGTHAALLRANSFARTSKYALKLDIAKFYSSIDHAILKEMLRRKIKDKKLLRLLELLVDTSNPQEDAAFYFRGDDLFTPLERRRGIPIGNLTSQLFANVYLDSFDHYMKEVVKCRYFVRYMDDVLVFGNARAWLRGVRDRALDYLAKLRLKVNRNKLQIVPVRHGVNFLGFRLYGSHMRLIGRSKLRQLRRMKELVGLWRRGALGLSDARRSIGGLMTHTRFGNTYNLRRMMLRKMVFCKGQEAYSHGMTRKVQAD